MIIRELKNSYNPTTKLKTVKDLIASGVKNISFNILVFGPQVTTISVDVRTRNLQEKRIQIRRELENSGHFVRYAEELVDPSLPSPMNSAILQEIVVMREYDLIFVIVDSPGSIVEATLISTKPDLCQKSSLFLDSAFVTGLVAQTCQAAQILGADYNTYVYPTDLTDCNLLTFIVTRVQKAQFARLIA